MRSGGASAHPKTSPLDLTVSPPHLLRHLPNHIERQVYKALLDIWTGSKIRHTWLASTVVLSYKKKDPHPQRLPSNLRLNGHIRHPHPTTGETHNEGHDSGLAHYTAWRPERKKYNEPDHKINERPTRKLTAILPSSAWPKRSPWSPE